MRIRDEQTRELMAAGQTTTGVLAYLVNHSVALIDQARASDCAGEVWQVMLDAEVGVRIASAIRRALPWDVSGFAEVQEEFGWTRDFARARVDALLRDAPAALADVERPAA